MGRNIIYHYVYDEHGGFYDHVAPSDEGVPAPDDKVASNGFTFNQLGIRLPTVAISPLIPRGTIISNALPKEQPTETSQFESISIIATSNILLGLTAQGIPPLGKRMAWANTFAGLVRLSSQAARSSGFTKRFI